MKKIRQDGLIIIIALIAILPSCIEKSVKPENEGAKTNLKPVSAETRDLKFLDSCEFENLPLVDSTNFDNFEIKKILTKDQIKILKLGKIASDENITIGINYKLDLSPNYKTFVISYYPNENELYTILINYDMNYDIIDFKTIAYDEIAESMFKTKSKIESKSLEITDIDWSSGQAVTKITVYNFNENGKIEASR